MLTPMRPCNIPWTVSGTATKMKLQVLFRHGMVKGMIIAS